MPIDPLHKEDSKYFHFRIKRKDFPEVINKLHYVGSVIKSHRKGRVVLSNLVDSFEWVEKAFEKPINDKYKKVEEKVDLYIKNSGNIDVDEILFYYEQYFISVEKMKKKEFVKDCYLRLKKYNASHHKAGVVTAFFALLFGYKMSGDLNSMFKENLKITSDELFQSVRTIIAPLK